MRFRVLRIPGNDGETTRATFVIESPMASSASARNMNQEAPDNETNKTKEDDE